MNMEDPKDGPEKEEDLFDEDDDILEDEPKVEEKPKPAPPPDEDDPDEFDEDLIEDEPAGSKDPDDKEDELDDDEEDFEENEEDEDEVGFPDDEDDENIDDDLDDDTSQENLDDKKKPASKPFYKKPVPIFLLLASVGVIALLILVPLIGSVYVNDQVANTEIDVLSMAITDSTESMLGVQLEVDITEPPVDVEFDSLSIELHYNDQYIGFALVGGSAIKSGTQTINAALIITDDSRAEDMIQGLLAEDNIDVQLKGYLKVHPAGLFSGIPIDVDLDKTVTIPGLGGLEIEMAGLEMLSASSSSCSFEAAASITNPSEMTFELNDPVFSIDTEFGYLGNATGPDISVSKGTQEYTITLNSNDMDSDVLNQFASNYLSGSPTDVTVSGNIGTGVQGILGNAVTQFSTDLTITPDHTGDAFTLDLEELDISYFSENLVCGFKGSFNNPTSIEGDVDGIVMTASNDQGEVGKFSLDPFTVKPGENKIEGTTQFNITSEERMAGLADIYLNGGSTTLTLSGDPSAGSISSILSTLSFPVTIENDKPLTLETGKIEIISIDDAVIDIELNATFDGPEGLSAEFETLMMDLAVNGTKLGTAVASGMDITLPEQKNIEASILIENKTLYKAVISDYLAGETTVFQTTVSGKASPDKLVNTVVTKKTFDIPLEGGSRLTYAMNEFHITATTEDSITVLTNNTFHSPVGIQENVSGFSAELTTTYGSLGTIDVPELNIIEGENIKLLEFTLSPGQEIIGQLVTAYMDGKDTVINIEPKGDSFINTVLAETKPTATLGAGSPVKISEIDYTLTSLDLVNNTLGLDVLASVSNPTQFSLDMVDLRSDLSYNGDLFAYAELGTVEIVPGTNVISRSLNVTPLNMDVLKEVASYYLSGTDTEIDIDLRTSFGADCLVESVTRAVLLNVTMDGLESGIDIDLGDMSLVDISDTTLTMQIDAGITNPTFVEGPLPELEFEVYWGPSLVGLFTLPEFTLRQGTNIETLIVPVTMTSPAHSQNIIDDLLGGTDVDLRIKAGDNGDLLTYLLSSYDLNVTLESNGVMNVSVNDFKLLSADSITGQLQLQTNVTVFNPTNFPVDVPLINVDVEFHNSTVNAVLGKMNITNISVLPGTQDFTIIGNLTPYNLVVVRAILQDHLGGLNVTLTCRADVQLNPEGGTPFEINTTDDIILIANKELEISIDDVVLKDTGSDWVIMSVVTSVYNPTMVKGDLPSMPFEIEYDGSVIGTLDTDEVYLDTGWNTYEFDANITGMSTGELDGLVSDFLAGNPITVTVRARATTVLGYLLSGLEIEIEMGTGVSINITISNIVLKSATSNVLTFDVDVGIINPTTMTVGLNDTLLDVFYKSEDIGDLAIDNQTLQPGENTLQTTLTMTSANQALLEEIISNHISGTNTTLTVSGTYNVSAEGASAPVQWALSIDVVFTGVTKDVIEKITVDDITVNVGINPGFPPTPWATYTVDITAKVHNPTDIPFNLTNMYFKVYFDDPDGVSYMGVSFPAKSNIFLTTIDEVVNPVMQFNSAESKDYSTDFTGSNVENGFRLYDENSKGQLKLDIRQGKMDIEIGDFDVQVDFSQENVPVS